MQHTDLPITHSDEDKLKFQPFVDRVAFGIKNYKQKECFIISIEGQWGIGKTSFMNLVKNEIKNDVEILHFNPWLISNIEQLISVFFDDLIKAICRISFDTALKIEIEKDLKAFLSVITPDRISMGVTEGSKATWNLGKYFKGKDPESPKTLYEQKEKINKYLRAVNQRIVIVIDDIDRLMDREVELVFRLIKGIADFDNITYILLFDREVVSDSLAKFKAEKGSKYLDKVIQYPLTIPKPHETTIVRMLTDRLDALLVDLGEGNYHFDPDSWGSMYRILGKYIKNVRDVNQIFDTFSFEYSTISKDVNFTDFFVITLIRLHAYNLYKLIKNRPELFNKDLAYLSFEMYGDDADKIQEKMIQLITEDYPGLEKHLKLLKIIFPVFDKYSTQSVKSKHERKSIADSHYFDNYFSMTVSADKLSYDQHASLVKLLLEDIDGFVKEMQGIDDSKLQQFFEMFKDHTSSNLNEVQRSIIIANLIKSSVEINRRDFRNDKSYCDFSWYSLSWIDLAAEELLKLSDPKSALTILVDSSFKVQYRCFLRSRIEHLSERGNTVVSKSDLEPYKQAHIREIQNTDISTLLENAFLDEFVSCMKHLEIDTTELSKEFNQALFKDNESFFAILEKFIYKHVSMPRAKYPYSISKSMLKVLVELDDVQAYIDSIDIEFLSADEEELLKYWENDRESF